MLRISLFCALVSGFAALTGNGTAHAAGHAFPEAGQEAPAPHARARAHAPARNLAPETRYRDPRYAPAPRRAVMRPMRRYASQPELFQAYQPRPTELPMYNEPPARFPKR